MRKQQLTSYSLFILIIFSFNQSVSAQAGQLDSSFKGTGISYQSTHWMIPTTAFFQNDGQLLITGFGSKDEATFGDDGMLLRYKSDGTPDDNFGTSGRMFTDFGTLTDRYFTMALQADGKIVSAGTLGDGTSVPQKSIIARYDINGNPDSSFGQNGKAERSYSSTPYSIAIYPIEILDDKRILLSEHVYDTINGNYTQRILKTMYNPNGIVDSSFGINGTLQQTVSGSPKIIDDYGRRIFIDSLWVNNLNYWKISRQFANGTLDVSFNSSGTNIIFTDSLGAYPRLGIIQPDKKILIGGAVTTKLCQSHGECRGQDIFLMRLTESGILDSSFGNNGTARLNFNVSNNLSGLFVQADGKIIIAEVVSDNPTGFDGTFALARFSGDGKLDSSFGVNGKKIYDIYREAFLHQMIVKDKRIYLIGEANDITTSSRGVLIYAVKNDYNNNSKSVVKLCSGSSQTTLTADVFGTSYQWQQSTDGVNFSNINDNNFFEGTTASTLLVKNIQSSWSGYAFRCITNADISSTISLDFVNTWTGAVSNNWEDAANWSCGQIPDEQSDVVIYTRSVIINSDVKVKSLTLKLGATVNVMNGYKLLVEGGK